MESLREEMYRCIEEYGPTDPKTVEVSQKLDIEVNKYMKKHGTSLEVT